MKKKLFVSISRWRASEEITEEGYTITGFDFGDETDIKLGSFEVEIPRHLIKSVSEMQEIMRDSDINIATTKVQELAAKLLIAKDLLEDLNCIEYKTDE